MTRAFTKQQLIEMLELLEDRAILEFEGLNVSVQEKDARTVMPGDFIILRGQGPVFVMEYAEPDFVKYIEDTGHIKTTTLLDEDIVIHRSDEPWSDFAKTFIKNLTHIKSGIDRAIQQIESLC